MDHLVFVDAKARELINLLDGSKSMINRGATGRKLPYGCVPENYVLYFINNNAEGLVKVTYVETIAPFEINISTYGNMDDWLLVENVYRVQV